jgi:hypothetical protein
VAAAHDQAKALPQALLERLLPHFGHCESGPSHMAALGVPVWLLLNSPSHVRRGLQGETVWYPRHLCGSKISLRIRRPSSLWGVKEGLEQTILHGEFGRT